MAAFPSDKREDVLSSREATDRGVLRDKVAVPDPAAVPLEADSEAAGTPAVGGATAAADAAQAAIADRAVPRLDPDRAVSTHDRLDETPDRYRSIHRMWIGVLLVLIGCAAGAAYLVGF
jgi:hypothetical protein